MNKELINTINLVLNNNLELIKLSKYLNSTKEYRIKINNNSLRLLDITFKDYLDKYNGNNNLWYIKGELLNNNKKNIKILYNHLLKLKLHLLSLK